MTYPEPLKQCGSVSVRKMRSTHTPTHSHTPYLIFASLFFALALMFSIVLSAASAA